MYAFLTVFVYHSFHLFIHFDAFFKHSFTFIISIQRKPIRHHHFEVIKHISLYIRSPLLFVLNKSL
jgi:hypothetical protein